MIFISHNANPRKRNDLIFGGLVGLSLSAGVFLLWQTTRMISFESALVVPPWKIRLILGGTWAAVSVFTLLLYQVLSLLFFERFRGARWLALLLLPPLGGFLFLEVWAASPGLAWTNINEVYYYCVPVRDSAKCEKAQARVTALPEASRALALQALSEFKRPR